MHAGVCKYSQLYALYAHKSDKCLGTIVAHSCPSRLLGLILVCVCICASARHCCSVHACMDKLVCCKSVDFELLMNAVVENSTRYVNVDVNGMFIREQQ